MRTTGDVIKERRLALGLTQDELGERLGLQKSAIAKYESGRVKNLKRSVIQKMAEVLEVTPSYLMGWAEDEQDDLLPEKESAVQPKISNLFIPKKTRIPLIGSIAAGTPILAEENVEEYIDIEDYVRADFCLRIEGDSMIDVNMCDGDIVFIRKQPDVEEGQIAAVVIEDADTYDSTATLKRVYRTKEGVQLVSANHKYPPMFFDHDRVRIIGKATHCISRVK